MKTLILLTLSLVSFGLLQAQSPSCQDSDFVNFRTYTPSDRTEHVVPSDGGDHHFGAFFDFACRYQSNPVAPTQYCVTTSATQPSITSTSESGELTNLFQDHFIGANAKGGIATGVNGATATTGGKGAGAVRDCLISCDVIIQLDGSSDGVGIKVTFPPSAVWDKEVADGIACGPILDPTFNSGSSFGGGDDPCPPFNGNEAPDCSPVILDVEGEGFHLTSAASGVLFDIRGDGHPVQIAWTAPGFHNAFLALDRNRNGTIDSGMELFGNFTEQPKSRRPNGFLALAEFDKPENGGNGDGVIDERDAVFSKLLLWIDENHDGISQPSELHKLSEFGIHSLSLSYFESRKTDEFGNQFRYKARVNPDKEHRDRRDETPSGDPGRWMYDVFFVIK
ncbi:MAG TPA: hypothetical protein VKE93_16290 [Candidatus Angelobacter sp.]|nr:hypothetical protein [Candidatus Angelobacter sp.]